MRKWLNVEVEKSEWALLKPFLQGMGVKAESSGMGNKVHVEVYVDQKEAGRIDDFLSNF